MPFKGPLWKYRNSYTEVAKRILMDGGEDDARSFSPSCYCCMSLKPWLPYLRLLLPKIVTWSSLPTAMWIQECRTGKYPGRWRIISRRVRTESRFERDLSLSSQYQIRSKFHFLTRSVCLPALHLLISVNCTLNVPFIRGTQKCAMKTPCLSTHFLRKTPERIWLCVGRFCSHTSKKTLNVLHTSSF
jgi:hypothetical protein